MQNNYIKYYIITHKKISLQLKYLQNLQMY